MKINTDKYIDYMNEQKSIIDDLLSVYQTENVTAMLNVHHAKLNTLIQILNMNNYTAEYVDDGVVKSYIIY